MSRLVNAVLIGFVSFLFLLAIFWYVVEVGQTKEVSVDAVRSRWGPVDAQRTTILTEVVFRNPHAFQVTMTELDHSFLVNGDTVAGGRVSQPVRIAAGSQETVPLRLEMPSGFVLEWWQDHYLGDAKTEMLVRGAAMFDVSGRERLVDFESEADWEDDWLASWPDVVENCPSDEEAPCIESSTHEWSRTTSGFGVRSTLSIHNPSDRAIRISHVTANLQLAGITVASTQADPGVPVAPDATAAVSFPISLESSQVLQWWVEHVGACERSHATVMVDLSYSWQVSSSGSNNTTGGNQSAPQTTTQTDTLLWRFPLEEFRTRFLCA